MNTVNLVGTTLAEASFSFTCDGTSGQTWRVLNMEATEGLSQLYSVVAEVVCSDVLAQPSAMLHQRGVLTVARAGHARRFCGVIRRVESLGATSTHRSARVYLVPEVWLLSQRFGSAIYQDLTAIAVVAEVLKAGHLDAPERLDLRLFRAYPVREYCVQHRESDLDFILRLLEHEGVGFYFDHAGGAERMVLSDAPWASPTLTTMDGQAVRVVGSALPTASVEGLCSFEPDHTLTSTGVILRDFDFTRPLAYEALTRSGGEGTGKGERAAGVGGSRVIYEYPGAYTFHSYQGVAYSRDDGEHVAEVRNAERAFKTATTEARPAEKDTYAGVGNVAAVNPGCRFLLADNDPARSGQYLVTRVEHRGAAPDETREPALNQRLHGLDRYRNAFEAVRATSAWTPARVTPKPYVRGPQTAMVVGPAGEEIHTDAHGRVKVRFHWDLRDGDDTPASLNTCWIRVAQSWAGAGWGAQFIPRVGMEVVVSFLDGDPDRPLVTGCVYNGAYPMPFEVPGDKARSGLRTQSSPGGSGFNELSFEDAKGAEQVYLHAQRDLDEAVVRNHSLVVGCDESLRVVRNQSLHVGGDRFDLIESNRRERVKLDCAARVDGNRETSVGQDETLRVEGNRYTVSTNDDLVVSGTLNTRVGRELREVAGMSDLVVGDDRTTRVEGNDTTVVGRHDAPRTKVTHVEGRAVLQASHLVEIVSDREIVLRVGGSRLRITDERIELMGKSAVTLRSGNSVVQVTPEKARVRSRGKVVISGDTVNAMGAGSQVKLSSEAKIKGATVKLNPPEAGDDRDDEPREPKVTTLELVDGMGRPLAGRRFVLRLDDGSEVAGVLDHEGRAELEVEGGGAKVSFPEVREVKPG